MKQEKLERSARDYAESAHGDQKYGEAPYVTHLAAVVTVLKDFGFSGDLILAGWLHDVLEDTKTTAAQLDMAYGSTVTHLVWAVTGVGKNRKERNENAYGKIEERPRAVILKLADRIANAEASAKNNPDLLAMYRREYPGFKARLERLGRLLDEEATVTAMWVRLDKTLAV